MLGGRHHDRSQTSSSVGGATMIERAITVLIVTVVVSCWLLSILPVLLPYAVALFVMAIVARAVWFLTQQRR